MNKVEIDPVSDIISSIDSIKINRFDNSKILKYILCFLSFLGIFISSIYSWMMTSTGFLVTNILPMDIALPFGNIFTGRSMAYVISGIMQIAIFCFYILLPYTSYKTIFYQSILSLFIFIFIIISLTFSLFSLNHTANAEKYYEKNKLVLSGIIQKINSLDKAMTSIYNNHIESLVSLAQSSENGNDESGIAKCGSICKIYYSKSRDLKSYYQGYLGVENQVKFKDNDDINHQWVTLKTMEESIDRKNKSFKSFVKKAQLTDDFEKRMTTIKSSIKELSNDYFGSEKSLDKNDLVLETVNNQIRIVLENFNKLKGTETLVFLIALLPDFLSISFSLLIYISRGSNMSNVELRDELRVQKEKTKLTEKINKECIKEWSVKMNNHLYRDF